MISMNYKEFYELQKLKEKNTPTEVVRKNSTDVRCPSCSSLLHYRAGNAGTAPKYCPNCGQALSYVKTRKPVVRSRNYCVYDAECIKDFFWRDEKSMEKGKVYVVKKVDDSWVVKTEKGITVIAPWSIDIDFDEYFNLCSLVEPERYA